MLRRKRCRFRRGARVVIAAGAMTGLAATVKGYDAVGVLTLGVDSLARGVLIRIHELKVKSAEPTRAE